MRVKVTSIKPWPLRTWQSRRRESSVRPGIEFCLETFFTVPAASMRLRMHMHSCRFRWTNHPSRGGV